MFDLLLFAVVGYVALTTLLLWSLLRAGLRGRRRGAGRSTLAGRRVCQTIRIGRTR